jgi:hypothetical protein
MSASKQLISVEVVDYRSVKESYIKSFTLFKIETKSQLDNLYDPNRVYVVERRFNDFKQLNDLIVSNPEY